MKQRNLTPKDRAVSTNLPTFCTHLRQLAAAGQIIKGHVLQTHDPSGKKAVASVSSNLALMHAITSHTTIADILEARLDAVVLGCTQNITPLRPLLKGLRLGDCSPAFLDDLQTFLQSLADFLLSGHHWV